MAKLTYEQLSLAKLEAIFLRDAAHLAMFGDCDSHERHCADVIEHLGKLATALGYLISPVEDDAATGAAEAGSGASAPSPVFDAAS
jgi:hypothetical protein